MLESTLHCLSQELTVAIPEKNGIPGSLKVLQQWLVDANRFSIAWIVVVEQTIPKVKEKAQQRT